jgi:3-deoxy-D-manno-octulosonic-acid transferase
MAHFIYNIFIHIYGFLIFIASGFSEKARKLHNGQLHSLVHLANVVDKKSEYVWFHAASLGEFEQGRPVIERLKMLKPEYKVLLTFFSPSGYEIRKNYVCADIVMYLPLDSQKNANKFLNTVKVSKAIFIKYEFWPNYLIALNEHCIPILSISSIFRSNQVFFKWYGAWYLGLLDYFSALYVQDNESKQLLNSKGIDKVVVSGDTRFDRVVDNFNQVEELPMIKEFCGVSKTIVAGSTWYDDEVLLVNYIKSHEDVKLILVPHEIDDQHISRIEALLECEYIRYTHARVGGVHSAQCIIVDTIGMLSSIYQYGQIAYIGGGFGKGIHNILEAAVYCIPVVFGPTYSKFKEAIDLVTLGGAFSINTYASLETTFEYLWGESSAGAISGAYVKENIGATEKILQELES